MAPALRRAVVCFDTKTTRCRVAHLEALQRPAALRACHLQLSRLVCRSYDLNCVPKPKVANLLKLVTTTNNLKGAILHATHIAMNWHSAKPESIVP
jgi:hypothetical protein